MKSSAIKGYVISISLILVVMLVFMLPSIPQDPGYHDFSDQRQILGIVHFWNVVSNVPLVMISVSAVIQLLQGGRLQYPQTMFSCYLIFFIAIGAVGIGSAYYHLQPANDRLFWDRLPMTVGFMAFMSIIIGEFIAEKLALRLMLPLILMGAASVIYWYFTEQTGQGDLRAYGLIQFLPMLIIPMILCLFPASYSHKRYLWMMLAAYLLAKLFEHWDGEVFSLIGLGGHAIKHVCAGLAVYLFLLGMKKRSRLVGLARGVRREIGRGC